MAKTKAVSQTKEVPCDNCGKSLTVNHYVRTPKRCVECGVTAAMESARQIRERSGPYFERWLSGIAAYASRTPRTSPLPLEQPDDQ